MKSFVIEVPATVNLGPGLDGLALALNIVDTVRVEFDEGNTDVLLEDVRGKNAPDFDPKDNGICRAYRRWDAGTERALPGARFTIESRIPVHRGLGSGAAATVAGLVAAAAALDDKQSRDRVLRLASEIVGQDGNCSAAVLGGLTASFGTGEDAHWQPVASHLDLGIALFVPESASPAYRSQPTPSRGVSPSELTACLGRLAFLTASFAWGRWGQIGAAMTAPLGHQNLALDFPHLDALVLAAVEAGAYGACLSGAGPTIVALAPPERTPAIAAAMERCTGDRDFAGTAIETTVRYPGISIKQL